MSLLGIDGEGQKIQAFHPDPSMSQVNSAMTGTKVFKKGSGADVDVTGWIAMRVVASAASTYYFNSDSTKTYPLPIGAETTIYFGNSAIAQVTLVLGAGTASIQGM
jgi:hypothetical protein